MVALSETPSNTQLSEWLENSHVCIMKIIPKISIMDWYLMCLRGFDNFCREHETLGKTPAEQAGIELDLEGNKVESLIRLPSTNTIS
jgi:hypothetical protein